MATAQRAALSKDVGSRGGQVVSYSPAGKPIYASSHQSYGPAKAHYHDDTSGGDIHAGAHAVAQAHPNYSASDHLHAAHVHSTAASNGSAHHEGHANFLSQSHAMASMSMRHAKSVRRSASAFKALAVACKSDMQDADAVDKPTARRMGVAFADSAQMPPTFDPDRDPNGTRQMPGASQERSAYSCDDGLADFIIASLKAQKSYAKPRASDYAKAPVLRPARLLGE